jgi:zinc transporter ZupT
MNSSIYYCISFPPSPIVYAILFGLIAGIMVFISVRELIPTGAHAMCSL